MTTYVENTSFTAANRGKQNRTKNAIAAPSRTKTKQNKTKKEHSFCCPVPAIPPTPPPTQLSPLRAHTKKEGKRSRLHRRTPSLSLPPPLLPPLVTALAAAAAAAATAASDFSGGDDRGHMRTVLSHPAVNTASPVEAMQEMPPLAVLPPLPLPPPPPVPPPPPLPREDDPAPRPRLP